MLGMWLVEKAISTNHMLTYHFENTGPGAVILAFTEPLHTRLHSSLDMICENTLCQLGLGSFSKHINWFDVGSMLGQRRRRWPNI